MRAIVLVTRAVTAALGAAALAACTSVNGVQTEANAGYGPAAEAQVATADEAAAGAGPHYQVGKPYVMAGRTYTPAEDPDYNRTGLASWYGGQFHGRRTADGEIFDVAALTGAHPTLPLPSYVRVTNLENDRSLIVRVNDRGPYSHGRLLDVSAKAAELLDFKRNGTAQVRVEYVGRAPLKGDDAETLLASYRGPRPNFTPDKQILLASAAAPKERTSTPATKTIAFVEEADAGDARPAGEAVKALTSTSIDNRIALAFQLVPDQDY